MVKFVAGDEVGERKNCDRVAARDAAAQPRFFTKRVKQRQAGLAHVRIFFHKIRQFSRAKAGAANVIVLFKTLKRGLISARNPQGAIGENSLRVGNVADDFLYTPLIRRVPEIAVAFAAA